MIEYNSTNIMSWTRLGMRKAFGPIMEQIVRDNSNIIVLTADVANSCNLENFQEEFPSHFFNIGIAEQNMTGIASGLAKEGYNVFITSFAPFVSMRAYEAVRTLVSYMHLNVKVVGLGSGLTLGVQGNTHFCMEDISLMKSIPGMAVFSPSDCVEEAKCLEYLSSYAGPAYIRLTGIDGSPSVHKEDYSFVPNTPELIKNGSDIVILGTGSIVNECIRTSRALKSENLSCAVYNVSTLKPLTLDPLEIVLKNAKLIVSVEEHFKIGGLGDIVASYISDKRDMPMLLKIGLDDKFMKAGDYQYMLQNCGLSAQSIKKLILHTLDSYSMFSSTSE